MTQPREPDGRFGFNNPNQILRALVAARGQRLVAHKPTGEQPTDTNRLLRAVVTGDLTDVQDVTPPAPDEKPTANDLLRILTGHHELTFTDKENTDA